MVTDRVVLVTGASSGFGKLTGSLLAQRGFRVFGTSRKVSAESQDGVEMVRLDIASDQSVKECVSSVHQKADRIDVLINNAGQALTGGLEETSVDEAKAHFDSNFFGAVRMVNAILPEMRRRRNGQIINVASLAGTFPVPFEGYYGAAKAALITYTEVLRQEVKSLGVKVSVIEPGFFRTNLGNARITAANSIPDYDEMRKRAHADLGKSFAKGADPAEVAETIVKIIESPSPALHYFVGKEKNALLLKRILPASVMEALIRKRWRLDG
ncbi:MAG TPA: SDR family NAD(P)-dependent oxidoreductase [Candidatus Dormibacteraeota bacterium]|nr:SDR family NAD(P)-dependent oxidoreductase [Candidatus Dormibacteraeota bacterium]